MKKFLALMMALTLLCTSMIAFADEADGVVAEDTQAIAEVEETEAPADQPEETEDQPEETPAEDEKKDEDKGEATETPCDPHRMGVEDESRRKDATCTEDGIRFYTCVDCGEEYSVTIPATGHKEGENPQRVVVKEPTCTEEGELKHLKCAVCGKDWTTVMEKVPHTYGDVVTTKADCTHDEKSTKTCTVCGHVEETTSAGTKLGHDWAEQDVAKLPTCTEKGSTGVAMICTRCGATQPDSLKDVVEISELDHQKWLEENAGLYYWFKYDEDDEIDGVYVRETIPEGEKVWNALDVANVGHYGAVATDYKPATCTEAGMITVYCTECDAKIEQAIPALGHDLVMVENEQEGLKVLDCTKPNSILFACQREGCDYKFNQAFDPAKEHTFIEGENIVGYKQKKAADGELVKYGADEFNKIAKCCDYYVTVQCDIWFCTKTHDFLVEGDGKHAAKDYIIDVAPTCTEPGRKLFNCRMCGYYQDVAVPATGHSDLVYVKTLTEPDCTHTGVRLVKCTHEGCSYTEEQTIPALGHHYMTTIIEADCKKGIMGQEIKTCSKCGDRVIVREWTGHEVDKLVAEKDATCTEGGSKSFWCKHCHKLVTETYEALGHDWKETETIAPTCKTGKESGTIHKFECTRCNEKKTEVDDDVPEGHSMFNAQGGLNKFVVKTLPTCETAGVASYVCSVCGDLIEDIELPAIAHNATVTFNEADGAYELTCQKLAKTEKGRLKALLLNAGYDEKVAGAIVELMTKTNGQYFAGIGCDHVEKIEVKKTEYTITASGTRGKIELKEGCQPMKGDAYVRITWRYTLANGDTVSFTTCREVREDDTFKLTGLSAPDGSHCDFIYVEVVSDPDADELNVGEYATYGAKSL